MSRNPNAKYFLVWFHINGALSFFISAMKHFKRKNTYMVFINIKNIFWQIGEAGYEWLVATIHNQPLNSERGKSVQGGKSEITHKTNAPG